MFREVINRKVALLAEEIDRQTDQIKMRKRGQYFIPDELTKLNL